MQSALILPLHIDNLFSPGSGKDAVSFDYDAMGNRIAKHVYNDQNQLTSSTYYVLDGQGNTISTYEHKIDNVGAIITFEQNEKHIYGSSRLGLTNKKLSMLGTQNNTYSQDYWSHTIGEPTYEIANHLGNVLSVISDKPIPHDNGGTLDYYLADLRSSQDYSPFGVTLQDREYAFSGAEGYRYGFNGMEADDEVKGSGNSYDFGARMHDPRIGRWLSIDPLASKYPDYTPYAFCNNNPIAFQDFDGKDIIIKTTTQSYDGKNPSTASETAVTQGSAGFVYNQTTKVFDLVLNNHIQYSKAFVKAGPNGKTLEQENPGFESAVKTHEGVHVDRNIEAVKMKITYTTNLLEGGPQSFSGTADVVMTQIFDKYSIQRGEERKELVAKESAEINSKYSSLIAEAGTDQVKINKLKADAQAEFDGKIKVFDDETKKNVNLLGTKILQKVNANMATKNVHEGKNGVIAKTLTKLKAGSAEYKYQSGQKQATWQGKILK